MEGKRENRARDDASSFPELVWTLHPGLRTREGLSRRTSCPRGTSGPHVHGRREGWKNVSVPRKSGLAEGRWRDSEKSD